ncbi:Ig-like domain repeat protein [Methanosphaera sp. ISO3-F5]|uniref:Ig-like domain-containing protein n=1 Tax=Methanosphaera sp. ISO3-F5 TaxID=1452353 RepID=UPI002B256F89|nr:Ig-like domain repeat protein [Methanosphaera sp. ISO3-F5]WQH64221.1 Ig-like domain-containing protein [Methanosphaera sp. ISO3-F5]
MKKIILFTALLITLLSVASAADIHDTTVSQDVTASTVSHDTQQTDTNVLTKSNTQNDNIKKVQNVTKVKKETKNEENTRGTIHNINNTNFDEYVTDSGLTSLVNGNDTLNFTSNVTRTLHNYTINKPINITGNGFTLDLNTIYGYNLPSLQQTNIEFNIGANNSNITNLKFHNTQVFTTSASNITFDNINVTVDQGVGMYTGYFALRNGVINVTVKNSYFHAVNNTGCSAIAITMGENCTIDHNIIIGEGIVGNLIYLNTFNVGPVTNNITQNKNNVISSNTLTGPETADSRCFAITVGGPHNHIINNTINYNGKGITGNWAGTYDPATNTTNDYYNDTYLGNGYINNTLNNGAEFSGAQGSLVAGNNFTGKVTIAKESKVKDNRFYNTTTINQNSNITDNQFNATATIKKYINVKNSIFNSTATIGEYSNVTNNTFKSTVTLNNNINFKNNNAENSTVYVIGANCDLCGNRINTLVISAYPAYVCRDNIFTNYPTDPNISWYIHGSRNSNLNKNYLRSVKTSSVTEGIEYEEVDIDDEETFLKYFRFQEQGEAWLPLGTYITGNTRFKLGYFPEKGKLFYLMLPVYGQYMDSHFSIVGKNNLTLNNVGLYVVGTHCSISNLTLVYNLEDETDNTQPVSCQDFGMSGCYIEFDNLNITLNCEYGTINTVFGTTKSNNLGNIIIQNSIINVKCPASSFAVISNNAENTKILNNIINIEEKYNVGDNPYIIGIYGDVNSTLNHNSNNVTCINNIINMNGESTLIAIKIGGNTNTITNNNITVTTTGTATGVELTGNDNTVTDNYIIANDKKGDDAVTDNGENNIVENNSPYSTSLKVIAPATANINEATPITILLKDNTGKLIPEQEVKLSVGENQTETVTTDEDGIAVYNLTSTTSGELNLTITYEAQGLYTGSNTTVTINVNEDKDAIIEELNNTIKGNEETIEALNGTVNNQSTLIKELNSTVDSLNDTVQTQNNTINEQNSTINRLNDTVNAQESNIKDLSDKLNTTAKDLEAANKKVDDLSKANTDLNNKLNNTAKDLEAANDKIDDLSKANKDLAGNLSKANNDINNLTQANKELNNNLVVANKKVDDLSKANTDLNNKLNNTAKDLEAANDKIDDLSKANKDLAGNLSKANNDINNLTQANKELNNNLVVANKKVDDLAKANDDLAKQLNDTNKKVDEIVKSVDNLITQLNNTQDKVNNLTKEVADKDKTIKELTTKKATKITVDKVNTTTIGSSVVITGKLTDTTGTAINNMPVSIKINSASTKVVTNANGVYKYTTTARNTGTNNVTVSAIANDKYTTSSVKTTFKVNKANPTLKLNSISAVKFKDKVTVTGSLMDNTNKAISSASITLKINTKSVTVKTAKDGSFTYTTTAASMGTNNVTATYNGNTKYNKATSKTTFKVAKQNLILTVDRVASGLKYKDPLVVGGRLVDGNNKAVGNTMVSLKFNGKTYKAKTDKNGYYKVTTRATTMGKNTLTATYVGNTKYNKATAKTSFTVAKQDIIITFDKVSYANGKVTISGTFTDRNRHALMNSLARITLNGKQGTAKTNNKGTFTYTTKAKQGTYKVTLAYPGNDRYNAYSKTSTVKTA